MPSVYAVTSIDEIEQQIRDVEKKYGFPENPVLTEEQWRSYDAQMSEIDTQRQALFEQFEILDQKALEIGNEFGLEPWPDHPQEVWDEYNKEIEPLYMQLDAEYVKEGSQYDNELETVYQEFGFMTSYEYQITDVEFQSELEQLSVQAENDLADFENPNLSDQERRILSDKMTDGFFLQAEHIHEKYGYHFPELDAQRIYELSLEIQSINAMYN